MESQLKVIDTPGFCPNCGSVLPPMKSHGGLLCFICDKEHDAQVFGEMRTEYNIHFNKIPDKEEFDEESDTEEGALVDRKCVKCGNDKFRYATLQLRSADEGQTVFYTCTKCNYKETENS
ncbi:hypothetical protein PVAND_001609 [Polypedilum vanderplanki]|uniref:DNA-directed RNA polymerase subunit n=1 Tax=Polypedilum vanderplanki TaxID=319348 RepID=A0A9J6BPS4_POLVA|nr:hypothetical protein PVAND_001609 [Polypedilum vanderplanki]